MYLFSSIIFVRVWNFVTVLIKSLWCGMWLEEGWGHKSLEGTILHFGRSLLDTKPSCSHKPEFFITFLPNNKSACAWILQLGKRSVCPKGVSLSLYCPNCENVLWDQNLFPREQRRGGSHRLSRHFWASLVAHMAKQYRRSGFHPLVGKIPWRRAWQPTPVFLPGESHGQRRLVSYSPWGLKELDTTE